MPTLVYPNKCQRLATTPALRLPKEHQVRFTATGPVERLRLFSRFFQLAWSVLYRGKAVLVFKQTQKHT